MAKKLSRTPYADEFEDNLPIIEQNLYELTAYLEGNELLEEAFSFLGELGLSESTWKKLAASILDRVGGMEPVLNIFMRAYNREGGSIQDIPGSLLNLYQALIEGRPPPGDDGYYENYNVTGIKKLHQVMLDGWVPALAELEAGYEDFKKKNSKVVSKYADGPADGLLGSIAFGEERLDKEKLPFEKDTPEEAELYIGLSGHVGDNAGIDDKLMRTVQDLLASGDYPKFMKPPKAASVYRGMTASEKWLRKALKLKANEPIDPKGSLDSNFTYTPQEGTNGSSWSDDKKVAQKFAVNKEGRAFGEYGVVMTAETATNPNRFLDLKGGLYKLSGMDDYEWEKETIGLGKIKVSKVEWKAIS